MHNDFVATHALGHMMYGCTQVHKCMSCHKATLNLKPSLSGGKKVLGSKEAKAKISTTSPRTVTKSLIIAIPFILKQCNKIFLFEGLRVVSLNKIIVIVKYTVLILGIYEKGFLLVFKIKLLPLR